MDYNIRQLAEEFKNLEWDQVYSLVELVLSEVSGDRRNTAVEEINRIFHEEGVPYKIVRGKVVQLMTDTESNEIVKAQASSTSAAIHLNKAAGLFNKRPIPDYSNSVKESILAVESIVKGIDGNENGTLSSVLPKLKLHKSLEIGIKNLYDWTSDEGGIRHGLTDGDKEPDEYDARFMLVQCASIVNYLIARDTIASKS